MRVGVRRRGVAQRRDALGRHFAAEAGANTFVAGSAVFGGEVPAERIASLRDAASAHTHAHR